MDIISLIPRQNLVFGVVAAVAFLVIVFAAYRRRRRNVGEGHWHCIFDTCVYTHPRLEMPLESMGFGLQQCFEKNSKNLDQLTPYKRCVLSKLPILKNFMRTYPKGAVRYGIVMYTGDTNEIIPLYSMVEYLILDSRQSVTSLTNTSFVKIYMQVEKFPITMPTLDASFVKRRLSFNTKFSIVSSIYINGTFGRQSPIIGAMNVNHVFCDYYHPDRFYFLNIIKHITTCKNAKKLIVGSPGTGKTTLLNKILRLRSFAVIKHENVFEFGEGPIIIDEFDKSCDTFLIDLKKRSKVIEALKMTQAKQDGMMTRPSETENQAYEKATLSSEEHLRGYRYELLCNNVKKLFRRLLQTDDTFILVANSVQSILKLMNYVELSRGFMEAFFRAGRFCPCDLTRVELTPETIVDICSFYMPTLTGSEVDQIKGIFSESDGTREALNVSLVFDLIHALGFSSSYSSFEEVPDFTYRPSAQEFKKIVTQFKIDVESTRTITGTIKFFS